MKQIWYSIINFQLKKKKDPLNQNVSNISELKINIYDKIVYDIFLQKVIFVPEY